MSRVDPEETSAHVPAAEDVASGETMQLAPRVRAAVELPIVPEAHYDRENEIARGGMGRIVAAWDRRLGRPVAIKELLRGTPALRRRFEREAVMTARLQHPAIINVYEAGRWPAGEPFFAMKRVEGESLVDVIHKTKSLNERLALLPNLISIVEAMAYAHGQNVIHRDLKPANVLLGSFGETVVIDWGLAKDLSAGPDASEDVPVDVALQDGLTVVGTVLGTPAYMPPEQARGRAVDQRADVYALGAILYHLLAGRPPYTGENSAEVLKQVLDTAPEPLEDQQTGISQDLLTIVRKAMARDPASRYPTAKELAEDLKRFQTGQLVGAHAYTTKELLARWVARHRAPASIAAVAALLLVTTGILAVQRIARERNEAQSARRDADARNDELVLNQARNALKEDPTAAIAWLKNYSLGGPAWGAARMIAADARNQGVATRVLSGHDHAVEAVAFSPDSKLVASAGADRTVRLWDLASGASRVLKGHDWFIRALAFSPDGKWLGSNSGTLLYLWDVATGEGRSFRGRFQGGDLAFSPDGRSLVAVAFDDEGLHLLLWDPQTGFTRTLRDPTDKLKRSDVKTSRLSMAFTPDGETLLTQTDDQTLRLWDFKTGRSERMPKVRAFALSKDGRLLATADSENHVWVRDRVSKHERTLAGLSGPVTSLASSPDGRWVASASEDAMVRLWDLSSGELRTFSGHTGKVSHVAFSPDGETLASFGDDQTLRTWNIASGEGLALRGHREAINGIAFSPDGATLASASDDRSIRLWSTRAEGHRVLARPSKASEPLIRRIAFAPQGRVLAATGDRSSIYLFDLDNDKQRVLRGHDATVKGEASSARIRQVAFSPDGKTLATAGSDKSLRLWTLATEESRTFVGHEFGLWDVVFSPDGRQMASVSSEAVRVWDIEKGTARVLKGHRNPSYRAAFSPDGRWLASASMASRNDTGQQDLNVRIWDAMTGAGRELLGHTDTVTDVRFSRDGRWIASGSMDTTVRIWNAATERVDRVFKGDGSIVQGVAFSPDSRWVVSANEGGNIRLWNLGTGRSSLLKGREPVFSADSATLAAYDDEGRARLFDTETGEGRVLADVYSNAAISPDGKVVAVIGKDGAIHLWNDDLPRDPIGLKAWLQKATDHRVSAGSPGLTQPDRP